MSVRLMRFSLKTSSTSARAPGLWAVVNMMAVLSSPVRLAPSRLMTKKRVTLSGLSSMFSKRMFSPYSSAACFEPMAATPPCSRAIFAAAVVLSTGTCARSRAVALSQSRHWLNPCALEQLLGEQVVVDGDEHLGADLGRAVEERVERVDDAAADRVLDGDQPVVDVPADDLLEHRRYLREGNVVHAAAELADGGVVRERRF